MKKAIAPPTVKRSTRSGPKSDGIFTLISYRFFSAFLFLSEFELKVSGMEKAIRPSMISGF